MGALDAKYNSPLGLLLRVASSPHELHRVTLVGAIRRDGNTHLPHETIHQDIGVPHLTKEENMLLRQGVHVVSNMSVLKRL